MARRPRPSGSQPSIAQPSVVQPAGPSPLRQFLTFAAAAGFAPLAFVEAVALFVRTRWRGIILTHIFLLTIWLAVQVFLFARGGYWYLRDNVPTWTDQLAQARSMSLPLPNFSSSQSSSSSRSSSSRFSSSKFSSLKPTCWRDRSLDGDCFKQAEPHRRFPPPRVRIPAPPAPPCGRFYMCGSADI